MLSIAEIPWTELSVTAAASVVVILGIILNARRYQRPFPTLWFVAVIICSVVSHAWSLWERSKWPASIGMVSVIVLAAWLGATWKREMMRDEERDGGNG
jgi:uncharacterized membrane-anchored protein